MLHWTEVQCSALDPNKTDMPPSLSKHCLVTLFSLMCVCVSNSKNLCFFLATGYDGKLPSSGSHITTLNVR